MVNLDTVTFLDPASLYNKLELDVDDQKIAHIVKEKLSQPLARHGELACGYVRTDSGCGFLNTDTLEIIYNDEEVRQRCLLIRNGIQLSMRSHYI